jgi:hypothetical protein
MEVLFGKFSSSWLHMLNKQSSRHMVINIALFRIYVTELCKNYKAKRIKIKILKHKQTHKTIKILLSNKNG